MIISFNNTMNTLIEIYFHCFDKKRIHWL